MAKHNIDDPKHPHYLVPIKKGMKLTPTDPSAIKGVGLHQSGHLDFEAANDPVRTENPDGTVTDVLSIARTYNPNPKSK